MTGIAYKHLEGIPYAEGRHDCFGTARRLFMDNWQIPIRNYARVAFPWQHGINADLFRTLFSREGFVLVDKPQIRPGDVVIMQIEAPVPNHCGVLVGDGLIFHHYYRKLSKAEKYLGLWSTSAVMFLRHPLVPQPGEVGTEELIDFLPEHKRRRYREFLASRTAARNARSRPGESGTGPGGG